MRPRGHFNMDGLLFFAVIGFVLLGVIPTTAIAALIVLPVLKIWCAFSWWWLALPAGVLIAWALTFAYLRS